MLAQAMATTGAPEATTSTAIAPIPGPIAPATTAPAGSTTDPPAKFVKLFHSLLVKDRWPIADAEALARQGCLMLSGAIEALNEWSTDVYGGQLFVEEEGFIVVERSLIN
jgi:hypothetical protein